MQVDDATERIHVIEWRIDNFRYSTRKKDEALSCPISTAGNLFDSRWFIRIYPCGQEKYPKYLGCYLKRDADEKVAPETLHVYLEFSLLTYDGVQMFTKSSTDEFKRGEDLGFGTFVKLSEIFCRQKYLLHSDTLILRCKLQLLTPLKKQTSHQVFMTKFTTQTIPGQMILENFQNITKQNPQVLQAKGTDDLLSVKVSMNKEENSKSKVADGPKPETSTGSFLHMVMVKEKWAEPVHVICCIKLLKRSMKVALEREIDHLFTKVNKKEEYVLPYFIDTNNLPADCVEDDSLYLDFDFKFCDSQPVGIQTGDWTPLKVQEDPEETTLLKDVGNLHETKEFSDVTLRVGEETFRAHKAILAARSPRFGKIFAPKTNGEDQIVEITDVDKNEMALLLKFMYTDKLDDLNDKKCLSLYVAAQKYQIPCLQLQCRKSLSKNLSSEVVYKVLFTAEEFKDTKLKMIALDYILKHYETVLPSDEWNVFFEEHKELGKEVRSHIRVKKNQVSEE